MWGHWTYLILILGWAGPIILLQWLIGAKLLIRRRKMLILGILIPTLYLTFIDSFALHAGTWTIDPQQSVNVFLPVIGVPIEEAIFFLVTNTLIIQGMILILDMSFVRDRLRGAWHRAFAGRKHLKTTPSVGALRHTQHPTQQ